MYPFNHTKNRTIGLLGGSFNPAHAGHVHISQYALNKLHFDEVWWLVSPRNPLKSASDLATYETRLQTARQVARGNARIRVMDIEARFKTRYTYQTIVLLQTRFKGARFVWMMGADNLSQFHLWKRWQALLTSLPILVFDRAPYMHTSLRSKAMIRGRKTPAADNSFANPGIIFARLPRHPLSSTLLRSV